MSVFAAGGAVATDLSSYPANCDCFVAAESEPHDSSGSDTLLACCFDMLEGCESIEATIFGVSQREQWRLHRLISPCRQ